MPRRQQKVVIDEMLTKPSAVCPTLFVGLGGAGCRLVNRVARHLRRRSDYEERYRALVKFALVDTNVNDLESYRELADATFLISDFEKEEYADLASGKLFLEADPYFTQWVPQNYRFRAGDTAGAGQIRIESRLGVFYQMKHKDFVPKFRRLLEDLKSHELGHRRLDSQEIRIVVCYSVAGGTGSGCHLPIAYLLHDLAVELGKPRLIGVAILPAVFEDKTGVNRDGTFANAYAALKETEYLMKLGAPESRFFPEEGIPFHYDPSDVSKRVVRQPPFEFVYVVDKPQTFSVEDPVQAAADGLYLQFFSPLFGYQASDYDNFTQHQRFLVPHDFEPKGIIGFTTFYGSYGAAVLLVPVDGLVEYCAQAAAVSLLRASFLRSIPGEAPYASLRSVPDPFYEVALGDDKQDKPVHVDDFAKKEADQRDRLIDRLYMRRVRLLAACELASNEIQRYFTIFRHGQRAGEVPRDDGAWAPEPKRLKEDQEQLARGGMGHSICAIVLPAITGGNPQEQPGLLAQARQAMERHADEDVPTAAGISRPHDARVRASAWLDEFKRIGMGTVKNGYKVGTLTYPGMDSLVELSFLDDEAAAVDLAAKRYAVLSIRERVRWEVPPPERTGDFDLGSNAESDKLRAGDVPDLLKRLQGQAIDRAMEVVTQQFIELLGDLKRNLDRYAGAHREFEKSFDPLEADQLNRLRKLRTDGGKGSSANQYVLDAEALQIEDGRRLWDFYFEDKIAQLPELSLGNREIQVLLSDTVTSLSVRRGGGATSGDLDKLYTALRTHVERKLGDWIGGDPHSPDRERRDGLTLSDALELEVLYRALYRSNHPLVEAQGDKVIRELVATYRSPTNEEKVEVRDEKHRDYLRDKIKRLVKEKASLLCVYEEGRDQHGGVRPDNVFVAALDENFKNSSIEEAIRGADPNLHWLTSGWNNPKEIIFYRAVLNVPLYVFGRMREMKGEYERFKALAKRPKVLHIDHNWEGSLPDLDPDSAQETHRQELLRNHVVNFAALLTTPRPDGGPGFIVRRDGKYWLTHPDWDGLAGYGDLRDGLTPLGETLSESIQRLPEVLESEKVRYLPYQQTLRAVREGLAPEVLSHVVDLPSRWRGNHDELRNKYGPNRTPVQQEKLKDYADAYQRLREALEKLFERLSNISVEQRTLGEDVGASAASRTVPGADVNLAQSLKILEAFGESWKAIEDPNRPGSPVRGFVELFRPLSQEKLAELLERLRSGRPQATVVPAEG